MTVRGKGGRPKISIDWNVVEGMLRIQCTLAEIAEVLHVSQVTIEKRVRSEQKMTWADYSEAKRAGGHASLRRKQWEKAVTEGNVTMLIWLGKQYLGQSDKMEARYTSEKSEGLTKLEEMMDTWAGEKRGKG